MKKKLHTVGCSVLAFIMLVCSFVPALYVEAGSTSGTTTINIHAEYHQTEARTMVNVIGEFRGSDEAWWYAQSATNKNGPKEYPEIPENRKYLRPDTTLESIAMQRAAEISLMFSHTRPNGKMYWTAYPDDGRFAAMGENIAAGTSMNMQQAFEAWREDDYLYAGQGHRRNMLSPDFTCVGIAHANIDGIDYWVQEFGRYADEEHAPQGQSTPIDDTRRVKIEISDELLNLNADPNNPPTVEPPKEKEVDVEYHKTEEPPFALITYIPPGSLFSGSFTPEKTFMLAPNDDPVPGDLGLPDGSLLKQDEKISNLECTYAVTEGDDYVEVFPAGDLFGKELGTSTVSIKSNEYPNIEDSFIVHVIPRYLTDAVIVFEDGNEFEFNGRNITPKPKVYLPDSIVPLVEGTDYTLTYTNNRNAGTTATVTVNGTGHYQGSKSANFTITPISIKGAEITLEYESTPYTGQPRTPALVKMETEDYTFTVELPNRAGGTSGAAPTEIPIKPGIDYDIEYKNNTPIGKAVAIVHGKVNLIDDSAEGSFNIVKTAAGDALIVLEYASTDYDGTAKTPKVTVDVDGTALKAGTDFKVTYSKNTDAGTAGVKVEGLGDFSEIKDDLTFEIKPLSIEDAEITPEYTSADYTGKALEPEVTVMLDDEELDPDDDYTVKYSDNKEAGTAKITVTGKGNYTGKATASFTITPPPCEHSWGSGVVTKAATCKEKGVKTFTCSKCKETKTEEIAVLTIHTPGPAATCNSPQKCLVCGAQTAAATGKHTDANSDGKCDVCNASVPVPNSGSSNGNQYAASPAAGAGSPIVYQSTPTPNANANANANTLTVYQNDTPNPDTGYAVLLERTVQTLFVLSLTACVTVIPSKRSKAKRKNQAE